ncbi:TlpA family protein disulfide reductase [Anoxybacillus flavithermus]|uniref:TlpA family protein disulfide reductase n=1 Tax=Anoxybacillus flavithermus TaxID=33934 RepID=UPI0003AA39E7|nr:TlpA disulfide reductase family protein [Anoxybacillus flavithermus]
MKKKVWWFATFMIIVMIAVLVVNKKQEKLHVGDIVEEVQLPTLDGQIWKVEETRGKVTVLNFFATWCEPCEEELPELEAFYKQYKQANIFIISKGEPKSWVQQFVHKHQTSLPFLLDVDEKISKRFQIVGQPETVILDRHGVIREKIVGPVTKETLIEKVEAIQ